MVLLRGRLVKKNTQGKTPRQAKRLLRGSPGLSCGESSQGLTCRTEATRCACMNAAYACMNARFFLFVSLAVLCFIFLLAVLACFFFSACEFACLFLFLLVCPFMCFLFWFQFI